MILKKLGLTFSKLGWGSYLPCYNCLQENLSTACLWKNSKLVKSKLVESKIPPRSDSSLEAVEPRLNQEFQFTSHTVCLYTVV